MSPEIRKIFPGILTGGAVLFLTQCVLAPIPHPANGIGGGLRSRAQSYQTLQLELGGAMGGGGATYANVFTANSPLRILQNGLLVNIYRKPVFATSQPRGPSVRKYSAFCFFSVCAGDGGATSRFTGGEDPLVAIHSVDVQVSSYLLSSLVWQTVIINGWTKKDQAKGGKPVGEEKVQPSPSPEIKTEPEPEETGVEKGEQKETKSGSEEKENHSKTKTE